MIFDRYDIVIGADGKNSKIRETYFSGKEYHEESYFVSFSLILTKFTHFKRNCGFLMLSAQAERPFLFDPTVWSELWYERAKLAFKIFTVKLGAVKDV